MIPCPVLFIATDSDSKSRSVMGKATGEGEHGEEIQREQRPNSKQYTRFSYLNQCPCTILWDNKTCDKGFRYDDLLWVARVSLPYNQKKKKKHIIFLLTVLLLHFLSFLQDILLMLLPHGTLIVVGKAFMYCQSGPESDVWLALIQQGI